MVFLRPIPNPWLGSPNRLGTRCRTKRSQDSRRPIQTALSTSSPGYRYALCH